MPQSLVAAEMVAHLQNRVDTLYAARITADQMGLPDLARQLRNAERVTDTELGDWAAQLSDSATEVSWSDDDVEAVAQASIKGTGAPEEILVRLGISPPNDFLLALGGRFMELVRENAR